MFFLTSVMMYVFGVISHAVFLSALAERMSDFGHVVPESVVLELHKRTGTSIDDIRGLEMLITAMMWPMFSALYYWKYIQSESV